MEAINILAISKRLQKRADWQTIEYAKNAMIRECRLNGMNKKEAQAHAYGELDRIYPPEPPMPEPIVEELIAVENASVETAAAEVLSVGDAAPLVETAAEALPLTVATNQSRTREDGLSGLGDIPADWPTLPANAPLAAEISWVQANRLRVARGVDEDATVDLSKALSPAPSWAALGWLETSIRAYSKYCDIAAKATSQQEDEREHIRRERIAIDEVRSLLAEMVDTLPGT